MSKLEESAFGLSQEELEQIRYLEVLKKRKHTSAGKPRISDTMSTEAKIAMQLAQDDMKPRIQTEKKQEVSENIKYSQIKKDRKDRLASLYHRDNGFTEGYDRRGSARLKGDILDKDYDPLRDKIRGLGGTKWESAMEITEIVNHDDEDGDSMFDDRAIEEIAQRNSVEKCEVWMELSQGYSKDTHSQWKEEFENREIDQS